MFNDQFSSILTTQIYGILPADPYQYICICQMCMAYVQIQNGLQAQYASTGYPINWLSGGARIDALLASIGGGAVNTGGTGMVGGLQVLLLFAWAMGKYQGYQQG